MKLEIDNPHKIKNNFLPTNSPNYTWKVFDVQISDIHYHFLIERYNSNAKIDYATKISIKREGLPWGDGTGSQSDDIVYPIKVDFHDTAFFITRQQAKSALNTKEVFAFIVSKIPS